MKFDAKQLLLYAVTDSSWLGGRSLCSQVEAAIDGGATFVQLREKRLPYEDFLAQAKIIAALCRARSIPFVINDNAEIARLSGADGVHIGQDDMAAGEARRLLGPDKIIGVTAHTVEEALLAQRWGADYLGIGAAFVTNTKSDAIPMTRNTMCDITAAIEIPAIAIAGISRDNILQLKGCGLAGVALVSALFAQPDVKVAAQEMRILAQELLAKTSI